MLLRPVKFVTITSEHASEGGMDYDTIITNSAYVFFVIGAALVFIPPVIAISNRQKQTKEVFLMSSFIPNIIGLFCLLFSFWALLRKSGGDNENLWLGLITLTASAGIACSVIAAYHSVVLIRWRAD